MGREEVWIKVEGVRELQKWGKVNREGGLNKSEWKG